MGLYPMSAIWPESGLVEFQHCDFEIWCQDFQELGKSKHETWSVLWPPLDPLPLFYRFSGRCHVRVLSGQIVPGQHSGLGSRYASTRLSAGIIKLGFKISSRWPHGGVDDAKLMERILFGHVFVRAKGGLSQLYTPDNEGFSNSRPARDIESAEIV